jgi:hypothetical protein
VNQFPIHNIDSRLTEFLGRLNISIFHAEIFYTPPLRVLPLHIDSIGGVCKLNFVFGGEGSLMQWWQSKHDHDTGARYTNAIGTEYSRMEVKDCDLVWQQSIGQPSLINAGVPHQVINCTNTPRWCMSFCLADKRERKRLSWQQASKIFEQYCQN